MTDGSVYEGNWIDGVKDGTGKLYWKNGDIYDGNWLNNEYHGQGEYFQKLDQSNFTGNFINGKKEGEGVCKLMYGKQKTIIKGEWKENKRIGDFEVTRV